MSLSVLATGLLVTFAVVLWAALVLWGLICPVDGLEADAPLPRRRSRKRRVPPPVETHHVEPTQPVAAMPEPPVLTASPPVADNVVSLSDWREERKKAG